ncbi:C-C motif chemokine ligand 14 [Homo sapiens]|uniref:C-C motif chemokine n=2 Tax=Homo sapiens TaxID=9606 RepID=A0A087X089_HUMAN|nr:C-C motif chemokine ligand 14 [Homo sapiens]
MRKAYSPLQVLRGCLLLPSLLHALSLQEQPMVWPLTRGPSSASDALSSGGPYHPSECCFTYTTYKIPRQRIMDYYETNSQCSKPGIVFITKRGHSVCTNPSDKWVQDYIKDMKEN